MLNSNTVMIVEGIINIEYEQPKEGHTGGDIVHIDNNTFEIHYFLSTYFYHQTIAYNGYLKSGKYVRIYYIPTTEDEEWLFGDGKILKIDYKNNSDN